jgi:hypothetical protein
MPAFSTNPIAREMLQIELFRFDETSTAYIHARFEAIRADSRKGEFRRVGRRLVDAARINF